MLFVFCVTAWMWKYLSRDILVAHVTEHIFNLKSRTYEIANLCEYITEQYVCANSLLREYTEYNKYNYKISWYKINKGWHNL